MSHTVSEKELAWLEYCIIHTYSIEGRNGQMMVDTHERGERRLGKGGGRIRECGCRQSLCSSGGCTEGGEGPTESPRFAAPSLDSE